MNFHKENCLLSTDLSLFALLLQILRMLLLINLHLRRINSFIYSVHLFILFPYSNYATIGKVLNIELLSFGYIHPVIYYISISIFCIKTSLKVKTTK